MILAFGCSCIADSAHPLESPLHVHLGELKHQWESGSERIESRWGHSNGHFQRHWLGSEGSNSIVGTLATGGRSWNMDQACGRVWDMMPMRCSPLKKHFCWISPSFNGIQLQAYLRGITDGLDHYNNVSHTIFFWFPSTTWLSLVQED